MTREELKEHCERQIQQFERVEKIMPVTLNDWKRYEEHKLILELLEPRKGHWKDIPEYKDIAWRCSECEHFTTMKHNFCPNCGARMIKPQESEES